jgi:hypothetical protein
VFLRRNPESVSRLPCVAALSTARTDRNDVLEAILLPIIDKRVGLQKTKDEGVLQRNLSFSTPVSGHDIRKAFHFLEFPLEAEQVFPNLLHLVD